MLKVSSLQNIIKTLSFTVTESLTVYKKQASCRIEHEARNYNN